ncbi:MULTISPECIES: type II toxin-antitoxin system RatA family toxin [unclassified Variovorax]|jgi:ribosome-associated toxin RatA of RatAB toxin-antitoxin module|uniref:type II toxin-antitoxin system RatA family toxin n=1 Tax=unclassified Variovorax TaxID=663243 RepID=UPI0019C2E282|nr:MULTISPECIES: type II toxin-antitoxin system RatA family toxin [unclassified Variovorax]MBC7394634.1 type II toxin-antitoxin system RatA family toxin [Variovorax sp.]MEB0055821.1 type II toxin-antitoxin system RatA family toxin [Variovorax sp. LG9.2]MEB0112743.1 type II toxin-antitoxin system RatA family toxin [Variovorax sp. RTB1]
MKTVQKSVLIWYSAEEMYALVTDVAKYPEFLPWCNRASVIDQDESGMTAEVGLSFGGIRQSFTTRNTQIAGREVQLKLVSGPFSNLDGVWKFTPVGETGERACRVELNLNYGFSNFALQALIGPVFDKIASSLVEGFVKRAEQVYGKS